MIKKQLSEHVAELLQEDEVQYDQVREPFLAVAAFSCARRLLLWVKRRSRRKRCQSLMC